MIADKTSLDEPELPALNWRALAAALSTPCAYVCFRPDLNILQPNPDNFGVGIGLEPGAPNPDLWGPGNEGPVDSDADGAMLRMDYKTYLDATAHDPFQGASVLGDRT